MSESRLIDLETKYSHQEQVIEELHKTIHEQYLMIQNLEKNLKLLSDKFKAYSEDENPVGPASEKPPHY